MLMSDFVSFADGFATARADFEGGWVESIELDFIVSQLRVMVGASDAYIAGYLSYLYGEKTAWLLLRFRVEWLYWLSEKEVYIMNISKFDRTSLNTLRSDLQAVLDAYATNHGLEFDIGGIRFSDAEATIKVVTKIKGAVTRTDLNLQRMAAAYNLVLQKNGRTLVRYDTRKPKYPFIYEENGKQFKTTAERAKYLFAA